MFGVRYDVMTLQLKKRLAYACWPDRLGWFTCALIDGARRGVKKVCMMSYSARLLVKNVFLDLPRKAAFDA